MYLKGKWKCMEISNCVYCEAGKLKMITPFYHSAERERAKEIQNFINCSHTTLQATCTWKNLHWSRWIAECSIKDFQNICFKNKLDSKTRTSKSYNLQSWQRFHYWDSLIKTMRKGTFLSLNWKYTDQPLFKNGKSHIFKLKMTICSCILILLYSFGAIEPTWLVCFTNS